VLEGAIDVSEPSGSSWVVFAGNIAPIDVNVQAIAVCAS
jgi:hypothetical protein